MMTALGIVMLLAMALIVGLVGYGVYLITLFNERDDE